MNEIIMKEIIIDGIRYICMPDNITIGQDIGELAILKAGNIKIVILQRGWTAIGRFFREGNDCELKNAYIIRRWGTTKGLGQLALEGWQKETVLDEVGIMKFDYLTVVATIDCDETKWKGVLQ